MLFLETMAISLLCSSGGFINYLYFISLGYGISIAAIGAFLLLTAQNLNTIIIIIGALYIIYGIRLSLFLGLRECKNETYKQKIKSEMSNGKQLKIISKIFIWISVSFLYACQSSPLTFRTISTEKDLAFPIIGIIITILGLLLEAKADKEKSDAKKINPDRFVDTGLYKIVRCPNYLGEIIFWTGNLIGGIGIYEGIFQWCIVICGYILIVFVMFSGTRRIEIRQNKNYGKDPDYQKYIKTTPILLPLIPLYSVEKYTWLKA